MDSPRHVTTLTWQKLYLAVIAVLVGLLVGRQSYVTGVLSGQAAGFKQGVEVGRLAGAREGYTQRALDSAPSRDKFITTN